MKAPLPDARSTPPALRPLALLLVLALAFLQVSAFVSVKDGAPRTWLSRHPNIQWFSSWSMFTKRDRTNQALDVEGEFGGEWKKIPMGRLFPTRWESGYRWERSAFLHNGQRMRTLGAATCGRMAAAGMAVPERLRFTEVKWRKTRGSVAQPRKKHLKSKVLLLWTCGDPAPPGPRGYRL